MRRILEPCPDLDDEFRRIAQLLVGRMGLKQALWRLRAVMSSEALSRTRGSRRAAAHLLGVDRRYVQRLVLELGDSNDELAEHNEPSIAAS
jgi:hypothetical protein